MLNVYLNFVQKSILITHYIVFETWLKFKYKNTKHHTCARVILAVHFFKRTTRTTEYFTHK